jgi:hypothetical protein
VKTTASGQQFRDQRLNQSLPPPESRRNAPSSRDVETHRQLHLPSNRSRNSRNVRITTSGQ